jgi:uncharacterized membrane protein YgcG
MQLVADEVARQFEAEMRAKEQARPRPASTKRVIDDATSGPGASRLAQVIKHFWAKAGFDVSVEIIRSNGTGEAPTYAIRSNLVNGLPRVLVPEMASVTSAGAAD